MTSYDVALLVHLVAVIVFFSGLAVAAAAQVSAAARHRRPAEIAAVLRVARTGVLLVATGTVLVFVSGLWLIEETGHSLGDGWLALSLALLVIALLLGVAGGRKPKQARLLAERRAAEDSADPEIAVLLRDPVSFAINVLASAAAFAALVLMVWRPAW